MLPNLKYYIAVSMHDTSKQNRCFPRCLHLAGVESVLIKKRVRIVKTLTLFKTYNTRTNEFTHVSKTS